MSEASAPIKVNVTEEDIREGVCGDAHRCAVAQALARATGDSDPCVCERDWTLYICVHLRYFVAPMSVVDFVHQFDRQPRMVDGTINFAGEHAQPPKPFDFELPPFDSGKWEEACDDRDELYAASDLDNDGLCSACRQEEKGEGS